MFSFKCVSVSLMVNVLTDHQTPPTRVGGGFTPDFVWRSQLVVDLWFGELYLVPGSKAMVNAGDWGCIVRDLETIIVLVLLE